MKIPILNKPDDQIIRGEIKYDGGFSTEGVLMSSNVLDAFDEATNSRLIMHGHTVKTISFTMRHKTYYERSK